jgi:hypothetical protein
MKICKRCKKEIEPLASKCPYCQGCQAWYKHPQFLGLLPMLIVLYFIYGSSGLFNQKDYTKYKAQFTSEQVGTSSEERKDIHTFNIKNNSKYKWKSISYQYIGSDDDGNIKKVISEQEYRWVVQPNDSSMLSIDIDKDNEVKTWELKIVDMKSGRF